MNLLLQFERYIREEHLFQRTDKLYLAVSGGVDSVVLCELCRQAAYDFSIVHCNFQLREKESDADEDFVKQLGAKYNAEVFVKKFDTAGFATENGYGIQEAARLLRYTWFSEMAGGAQPGYVLTAHHANDNMETVLMNFFKGTGINGLQGIASKSGPRNYLVRPLLFAKKNALIGFAKENNLDHREDASNATDKYTRNYFRNQLIPGVQKVFPAAEDNLLDNIERFKEINILYRQSIEALKKKLVVVKGKEIHIPVLKLLKTEALRTVIYELLKEHGFTPAQAGDVEKLLQSESGKYADSAVSRVLRNRKWLIVSPLQNAEAAHYLIEAAEKHVVFPNGKLTIEKTGASQKIDPDPQRAQVDADQVTFPLLLRKWKQGDYFYPLGMQKKKKLSRFFIDRKLSLNQKEDTWVIESNRRIVWIVGLRIDDRFKVTAHTKSLLKIDWTPAH
jgi:tRNA(Ile)-lysidine synthase